MKILHKGEVRLHTIINETPKNRHVKITDGKNLVVIEVALLPGYRFVCDVILSKDLRIWGKNSRGACFDGYNIWWPDPSHP